MPALQEPTGMRRSLRSAARGGAALAVLAVIVWMARGSQDSRAVRAVVRLAPSSATAIPLSPPRRAASIQSSGRGLPLLFAENRGQMPAAARFAANTGLPLWLTDEGLRMRLTPAGSPPRLDETTLRRGAETTKAARVPQGGASVFLTFEGARPGVRPVGLTPAPTKLHYFLGNDPSRWVTKVPTWTRLAYTDLYPGIDVQVHGENGVAEYDLLLNAYAELEDVVLRVDGAQGLRLDGDGSLLIDTAAGTLRQPPPRTWEVVSANQGRRLACGFRLLGEERYGFSAPGRDRSRRLVVDPELTYGTYLGGNGVEVGFDLACDASGCAVVVGETGSGSPASFPTTPGAFQTSSVDAWAGFVTKMNAQGTGLAFSTYLGGTGSADMVQAVVLGPDGSITVAGVTDNLDFPVTPGSYDHSLGGLSDAFVSRLTADGSTLIFSTYIGGDQGTEGATAGIALDSQARVLLALSSTSTDFPTTPNAYKSLKGISQCTAGRLSASGQVLEYSSWLPEGTSTPWGMAASGVSQVHVVGGASLNLPLTAGAIDTTKSFAEGFVVTMDVDAGTLDYASYLGGSFNDSAEGVATDAQGAVYVTGTTESADFPVTVGAFDTHINGFYDTFLVKLSPDGSILDWGTYLGGVDDDEARSVAIRPDGSVTVASEAGGIFPTTPDAFDSTFNNHTPLGLSVLSADGSELLYGTYLGGNTDFVLLPSVCVDSFGATYVTGYTADNLFPTTPGAFDTVKSGNTDAFVAKFQFGPWNGAGPGLAGTGNTVPQLLGDGSLQPSSAGSIVLTQAKPLAQAFLLVGLSHLNASFKGGTMVPNPLLILPLSTDASGSRVLSWSSWPPGLPAGTEILLQYWIPDAAGPAGFASSNGLSATVP